MIVAAIAFVLGVVGGFVAGVGAYRRFERWARLRVLNHLTREELVVVSDAARLEIVGSERATKAGR